MAKAKTFLELLSYDELPEWGICSCIQSKLFKVLDKLRPTDDDMTALEENGYYTGFWASGCKKSDTNTSFERGMTDTRLMFICMMAAVNGEL